jgi:hypothetical protein
MERTVASPATSCAAPAPVGPGTKEEPVWPEQLTFGSTIRSVEPFLMGWCRRRPIRDPIILRRRSSTLYEWENQDSRIRVERFGERWQGTMVVQRCNLPMSSLCSAPQEAADTLQAAFLGFYNSMKNIRLRNGAIP